MTIAGKYLDGKRLKQDKGDATCEIKNSLCVLHNIVAITSVYRCIRFVPSPYTVPTFDLSHFCVRSLAFSF